MRRDELFYVGAVTLAFGLAQISGTSAFVVAFVAALALLPPVRRLGAAPGAPALDAAGLERREHDSLQDFADRLHAFGARCERLVEAALVLALGVALAGLSFDAAALLFGLALTLVARPLAVWAVVRRSAMQPPQRLMLAWFGIRGIGTLYYLAFAIDKGVEGALAEQLLSAALLTVALSIVLHGISATPLMARYHARAKR